MEHREEPPHRSVPHNTRLIQTRRARPFHIFQEFYELANHILRKIHSPIYYIRDNGVSIHTCNYKMNLVLKTTIASFPIKNLILHPS